MQNHVSIDKNVLFRSHLLIVKVDLGEKKLALDSYFILGFCIYFCIP